MLAEAFGRRFTGNYVKFGPTGIVVARHML